MGKDGFEEKEGRYSASGEEKENRKLFEEIETNADLVHIVIKSIPKKKIIFLSVDAVFAKKEYVNFGIAKNYEGNIAHNFYFFINIFLFL